MKFRSVKVENMFAYSGPSEINLAGTTSDRNIIVISGRNGAGKTSLLNAVKLLFLGSNDPRLRRVGFGGTELSRKQYVLGQPGRWYGVFNAASRASFAAVSLTWTEEASEYEARRTFWLLKGGSDFDEKLRITVNGTPLPEKDAATKLATLLPAESLPFFFFDGEQIQSLADAEIGREQTEIERLLGFSFFAQLIERIDGYAKEKSRAGLPDDIRVKVVEAENGGREARARAEANGRSRVQEEEIRLDLERTRDRLSNERERLRSGTLTPRERMRIENRIAVLEGERADLALQIAETVPVELPFLANRGLVEKAFAQLNDYVGRATDNSVAARLHREFHPRVVDALQTLSPPVEMTEAQRLDLAAKMAHLLDEFGIHLSPGNPLFQSLSPRRIGLLRDQFLVWTQKGPATAAEEHDSLLNLRKITVEVRRIKQELDEAELTTEDARIRFAEISDQISNVQKQLDDAIARIAELFIKEQQALREITHYEERVSSLEAEYRDVAQKNDAYMLALRTKQAFETYRDLKRRQVRASVERRLNERVQILLAPSQLIRSIRLNEDFVMSYFDERDTEVARLSISAGMRQLLAMAMLWALKDEAGRPIPVIVDTPLGRIDRANRHLLMTDYFPQAGDPLVLLPTDTEFGADAFETLSSHICRRYRIENDGGDSAKIIEDRQVGELS
ncbi:AAA family ATPase [Rhizobium sp. CBN3]|uniref:AAA family ATPase n=1 Tax=Rhizobium sp. CBN3 TaxID=3058045 RepID=UPI002673C714|nr:AAA family ATPase [Rhizobium sp. CBN3]MDO3431920.1 AAA family ATPase [Rhizobium sp. CBN3]